MIDSKANRFPDFYVIERSAIIVHRENKFVGAVSRRNLETRIAFNAFGKLCVDRSKHLHFCGFERIQPGSRIRIIFQHDSFNRSLVFVSPILTVFLENKVFVRRKAFNFVRTGSHGLCFGII